MSIVNIVMDRPETLSGPYQQCSERSSHHDFLEEQHASCLSHHENECSQFLLACLIPAICQEFSGQTVGLKKIEKARSERRKQVRAGLSTRTAVVEQFLAIHHEEAPPQVQEEKPEPVGRLKLKGYINYARES